MWVNIVYNHPAHHTHILGSPSLPAPYLGNPSMKRFTETMSYVSKSWEWRGAPSLCIENTGTFTPYQPQWLTLNRNTINPVWIFKNFLSLFGFSSEFLYLYWILFSYPQTPSSFQLFVDLVLFFVCLVMFCLLIVLLLFVFVVCLMTIHALWIPCM